MSSLQNATGRRYSEKLPDLPFLAVVAKSILQREVMTRPLIKSWVLTDRFLPRTTRASAESAGSDEFQLLVGSPYVAEPWSVLPSVQMQVWMIMHLSYLFLNPKLPYARNPAKLNITL